MECECNEKEDIEVVVFCKRKHCFSSFRRSNNVHHLMEKVFLHVLRFIFFFSAVEITLFFFSFSLILLYIYIEISKNFIFLLFTEYLKREQCGGLLFFVPSCWCTAGSTAGVVPVRWLDHCAV